MKIEKRITENDVKKIAMEKGLCPELVQAVSEWQLQTLKDQQAKDAEFEIIQPKQLT